MEGCQFSLLRKCSGLTGANGDIFFICCYRGYFAGLLHSFPRWRWRQRIRLCLPVVLAGRLGRVRLLLLVRVVHWLWLRELCDHLLLLLLGRILYIDWSR